MECMTCSRQMVISRGTICKTCDEILKSHRESKQTSQLVIESIGDFSLFEDGPKMKKFVRRDIKRKR